MADHSAACGSAPPSLRPAQVGDVGPRSDGPGARHGGALPDRRRSGVARRSPAGARSRAPARSAAAGARGPRRLELRSLPARLGAGAVLVPRRARVARRRRAPAPRRGWWLELLLLALVIAFVAVIRIRLLDVPLERDEGEYAYIGRMMLEGVPPYAQAYNMKFPGIYACYAAVLALFGPSGRGVHLGLLVVNAAAIVLVF